MGYREFIKNVMGYDDSEMEDACVNILTTTDEYPLSFIEFETKDYLVIKTTRPDLTEGLVVLNKRYVTSVAMVYQDDIELDLDVKEENISYG